MINRADQERNRSGSCKSLTQGPYGVAEVAAPGWAVRYGAQQGSTVLNRCWVVAVWLLSWSVGVVGLAVAGVVGCCGREPPRQSWKRLRPANFDRLA